MNLGFIKKLFAASANVTASTATGLVVAGVAAPTLQAGLLSLVAIALLGQAWAETSASDVDREELSRWLFALLEKHRNLEDAVQAIASGQESHRLVSAQDAVRVLRLLRDQHDEVIALLQTQESIVAYIGQWLSNWCEQHAVRMENFQQSIEDQLGSISADVAQTGMTVDRVADQLAAIASAPLLSPEEFFRPFSDSSRLFHHEWHVVGRQAEFAALRGWLQDPDRKVAILPGRGGIGKTAILKHVAGEASGQYKVFFVAADSDVRTLQDRYLAPQPHLLIVDDAHRLGDLGFLASLVTRSVVPVKLLLAIRPHAVQPTRSEVIGAGIDVTQLLTLPEVVELTEGDRVELARQALGPGLGDHAERLAAATWDSPLVTVVAGQLIARKHIDLNLLGNQEEFRAQVLERFYLSLREEMAHMVGPAVFDRLVPLIAAVGPIWTTNEPLLARMAKHLDLQPHEVSKAIGELRAGGLLLGRGRALRITPDVLCDYVLRMTCVSADGRATGYAEHVFRAFSELCPQQILRNLAELDWRIRRESSGPEDLLASIWAEIETEFDRLDVTGQAGLLAVVETVAFYQPEPVMRLVRKVISKDDHYLRSVVTRVLGEVAYNLDYRRECCLLLWEVGKDDTSPGGFVANPAKVLTDMAAYRRHMPVIFNEVVLDAVEEILRRPDAHDHHHSLLDVADQLLKKTAVSSTSNRYQVTMQPFAVNPDATAAIRARAFAILESTAHDPRPSVALRAVKSLCDVLEPARMAFGNRLDDARDRRWDPDRSRALGILADVLARSQYPIVRLKICIDLLVNAYYRPSLPTSREGKRIASSVLYDRDMRLIDVLWDHRHHYEDFDLDKDHRELDHIDYELREKQNEQRVAERASELVKECPNPAQGLAFLDRLVGMIHDAGLSPTPGRVAFYFGRDHPSYATALAQAVLRQSRPILGSVVGMLVSFARQRDVDQACELLAHAVASTDVAIRRSVAWGFWNDRALAPDPREYGLFEALLADHDESVRSDAAFSLRGLRQHDPARAAAYATSVEFDSDSKVAEKVCMLLDMDDGKLLHELSDDQLRAVVRRLANLDSIDDHWIMRFIDSASSRCPLEVFDLLVARIDRGDEAETAHEYQALPYSHSRYSLEQISKSAGLANMLRRLRDRLVRQGTGAAFWVPNLYWWLGADVSDDRPVNVLVEWLDTKDEGKAELVAHLIHSAPTALVTGRPDNVVRLLVAAEKISSDAADKVTGALLIAANCRTKQGKPGEPFPEDVSLRKVALTARESFPPGSTGHKFYQLLVETADREIRRQADQWAEEELV